jgi:hypothetical protein
MNKRLMAKTITRETKKEGQRKAKRQTTRKNQKKEKARSFHGGKLSPPRLPLMSLACKS